MEHAVRPDIEFRIANFAPSQHIYEFVNWLLAEATKMGVPPGALRKLVIADDASYGSAIREFDPDAGYTNDGIYLGVGKTLPECVNGSFVGSNLVIHHSLLGCYAAEPDPTHPPGELEAFRYTFFHEMGHCIDNRRRPAQHALSAPPMTRSHLKRCAALNSATLFGEYAACFFSAGYMLPLGFTYFAESAHSNLERYLAGLGTQHGKYLLRCETLDSVRDAALDAFWRGLLEYAKLFALCHGNSALNPALPCWPGESPESEALLQKFAGGLKVAWKGYPDCLPEFERITTETWFELAETEDYLFEARPEGDHLQFV